MEKYKVLDLFAGAGGLSLGFYQTDMFETVMAVEINKNAAQTYSQNHGITVNTEDIRKIDFTDTQKLPALKDVTIVIGGPPCQGFSNANRQRSELFSNNNLLVKEFVRAIKEIKPKAFVMENVKTINSDKHKFFVTLKEKDHLNNIGINVTNEELFIGNALLYNQLLVKLFNKGRISTPFIEDNLYKKFKSLLRYYKKNNSLSGFFNKNKNLFENYLKNWEQHFSLYNSLEIEGLIRKVKDNFHIIFNDCKDPINLQFLDQINQVIEIHNISLIFKEIIEKEIDSSSAYLKHEKGIYVQGNTFTVIDYLLKTFESLGYSLAKGTLNAAHYGVPQERNRFFIIGINNTNATPSLPIPIIMKKDFFNIGHAIKDIEDNEPSIHVQNKSIVKRSKYTGHPLSEYLNAEIPLLHNHIITNSTETALKRFESLDPGQNFHNLDESLKTTYTNTKRTQNTIYKRLNYSEVSNTVVNVRKSMWIHPTKNRAISIREAARLQSFPDDYIFIGTKDSQYQQVGNAVPPLLGRAVAEELLSCLSREPSTPLKILFKHEKAVQ